LKRFITIELFGQKNTFATDTEILQAQSSADYLREEVARVENQIKSIFWRNNKLSILTIAALNISNEYIELKNKYDDLLNRISKGSISLIRRLDNYKD